MTITLWSAGDEQQVIQVARISSNQDNTDAGLLGFLLRNNHWSPFEMISANIQFETTRDIGRQILRHRSFSFQEFSGRYAQYGDIALHREVRWKGSTNRQGSVRDDGQVNVAASFERDMRRQAEQAFKLYNEMVEAGVATECARAILPEGFVPTLMAMNGTARSWIHYFRERRKLDPTGHPYAQREHYDLAGRMMEILRAKWPTLFQMLDDIEYIDKSL